MCQQTYHHWFRQWLGRRQAIICTNDGLLFIGLEGTNFSGISIEIHTFSFKKIDLKIPSGKWRPFCLDLNVINECRQAFLSQYLRQWSKSDGYIYIYIYIYKYIDAEIGQYLISDHNKTQKSLLNAHGLFVFRKPQITNISGAARNVSRIRHDRSVWKNIFVTKLRIKLCWYQQPQWINP